ncbi:MAG: hypothetical protein DDT19_01719 [Syntrophomonadaceae bacterium]|nr:hypothetical protein [Bacillota bacterium]
MRVRDRLVNGYKGQEVNCPDRVCPCRPCYNPHNCGYRLGVRYVDNFVCLTNHDRGCPDNKPEPVHILRVRDCRLKVGATRVCMRCGVKVEIGKVSYTGYDGHRRGVKGG